MSVADPLARTLLVEIAGFWGRGAGSRLTTADLTIWAVAAILSRLTGVLAVATAVDTALTCRAVRVVDTGIFTGTTRARVVALSLGLLAVLVVETV